MTHVDEIYKLDGDISLILPAPEQVDPNFPYQHTGDDLIAKCQAAWMSDGKNDMLLNFRLVGVPGVGKNAAVYKLAVERKQELYIIQGHEQLTPEDIVVSAAVQDDGRIQYIASPLVASMVRGQICFFDEIGKLKPRSLAPLASVLDERRRVYSALLGRWIEAHPDFRFCCSLNPEDNDGFDLPDYIRDRTVPEFVVQRPALDVLYKIAVSRNDKWASTAKAVQNIAAKYNITLDARKMIQIVSYAEKIQRTYGDYFGDAIRVAFKHILGKALPE